MCALLLGVLAFGLVLLCLLCCGLKKDGGTGGDQGGGLPGTDPPRYNLRMRPTKPALDLNIYQRY